MKLTVAQKRQLFKSLANKSQYAVGVEMGFNRDLDSNIKVINAVSKIYREVAEDPAKYGISPDVVEMVEKGMEDRRKSGKSLINKEPEKIDDKELVLNAKQRAWRLVNKKLEYLEKNPRALEMLNLSALMMAAGISFDKAQIAAGQATEHIALMAKVDENVSVSDALAQMMKIREAEHKDE